MTLILIGVVSGALILGAVWGAMLPLPERLKGAVMAFAGGALITSLAFELFKPAAEQTSVWLAAVALLGGAVTFTGIDYLIDERWGAKGGGGLLAAVTLDGIPENLALGVSLIGASFSQVAALAAAIFASNLPEAAGGAANLKQQGWSMTKIIGLWAATAALLSAAAWAGNTLFADASDTLLAILRAFAGGAVVASLATEVFPQAYRESHHEAGVATALGLVFAFAVGGG